MQEPAIIGGLGLDLSNVSIINLMPAGWRHRFVQADRSIVPAGKNTRSRKLFGVLWPAQERKSAKSRSISTAWLPYRISKYPGAAAAPYYKFLPVPSAWKKNHGHEHPAAHDSDSSITAYFPPCCR